MLKLILLITINSFAHDIDLTHLPLGDGKLTNSPKKNYIWACRTDPDAGGAFKDGPWIRSDGTYDITKKPSVPEDVKWNHQFTIKLNGDKRIFTSNDLPEHGTGVFPIESSSEAYRYDRNPNKIQTQNFSFELPANPTLAKESSCAPGAVGILLSGVSLFNALDAPGRDAVAHEVQDSCQGHPQESGVYHYHNLSSCVKDESKSTEHSALLGYAIDGFGIFGNRGEKGEKLSSDDLDECHGHSHEVIWDGKKVKMYHYHATPDFPYTVGCLRGNFDRKIIEVLSGPPGEKRGGRGGDRDPNRRRPDLAKAAKSLGISEEKLRRALGPPPPDLQAASKELGISFDTLKEALDKAQ